jgi:hypothetical protein
MCWRSWITPVLLLAACGGVNGRPSGASESGAEHPLSSVQYLPGEHMEWEVRWFGVLVGRVQLAAGQPGQVDGRQALVVRSLAISDGALAVARRGQMELLTWIDLDSQLPLAQAGSFDEIYTGEVLGTRFGASEWPRTPWQPALAGGQVAHSTHTALGLLRGWRAAVGDRGHVFVRMRHRVLRIDMVAAGRERITSALGRRAALRIDGVAVPVDGSLTPEPGQRSFPASFWIDEQGSERVPLRIQIESGFGGIVQLDLVAYDPPAVHSLAALALTARARPAGGR